MVSKKLEHITKENFLFKLFPGLFPNSIDPITYKGRERKKDSPLETRLNTQDERTINDWLRQLSVKKKKGRKKQSNDKYSWIDSGLRRFQFDWNLTIPSMVEEMRKESESIFKAYSHKAKPKQVFFEELEGKKRSNLGEYVETEINNCFEKGSLIQTIYNKAKAKFQSKKERIKKLFESELQTRVLKKEKLSLVSRVKIPYNQNEPLDIFLSRIKEHARIADKVARKFTDLFKKYDTSKEDVKIRLDDILITDYFGVSMKRSEKDREGISFLWKKLGWKVYENVLKHKENKDEDNNGYRQQVKLYKIRKDDTVLYLDVHYYDYLAFCATEFGEISHLRYEKVKKRQKITEEKYEEVYEEIFEKIMGGLLECHELSMSKDCYEMHRQEDDSEVKAIIRNGKLDELLLRLSIDKDDKEIIGQYSKGKKLPQGFKRLRRDIQDKRDEIGDVEASFSKLIHCYYDGLKEKLNLSLEKLESEERNISELLKESDFLHKINTILYKNDNVKEGTQINQLTRTLEYTKETSRAIDELYSKIKETNDKDVYLDVIGQIDNTFNELETRYKMLEKEGIKSAAYDQLIFNCLIYSTKIGRDFINSPSIDLKIDHSDEGKINRGLFSSVKKQVAKDFDLLNNYYKKFSEHKSLTIEQAGEYDKIKALEPSN